MTPTTALRDPSADRRPSRRPGRPARTSLDALVAAAIDLGLDRFTLPAVAERVGVAESTIYGYLASRDELFTAAAGSVFEQLDTTSDAPTWTAFVDVIAERVVTVASDHPGVRDYVLWGPYTPGTTALFESLVDRVRQWMPDKPDHVVFAVTSRPVVTSLTHLGDPVLEPMSAWLRRALLLGLDELLATGEFPDAPPAPWQSKLRA